MNIKRIITEAINKTVLENYVRTLEGQVSQLTKVKGLPAGVAYQYLCNLVAYCNEIKQSARSGNIEPNSNVNTATAGRTGGGWNKFYFDPHVNIYNNLRSAGIEIPFLNGVWDSAVRGYNGTMDFFGLNGKGKDGKAQKVQATQGSGQYPVRTLVGQLNNWKVNYSSAVTKDPNGSKVYTMTSRIVAAIFKTIEDINNALGTP